MWLASKLIRSGSVHTPCTLSLPELHRRLIRPQAKCRFEPTKDVANSLVSREEDIRRLWSYSKLRASLGGGGATIGD
jgi:hypothetical protein